MMKDSDWEKYYKYVKEFCDSNGLNFYAEQSEEIEIISDENKKPETIDHIEEEYIITNDDDKIIAKSNDIKHLYESLKLSESEVKQLQDQFHKRKKELEQTQAQLEQKIHDSVKNKE